MFRAHFCVLVGLGLMLAAASTEARQLEFFVENRLGGTDNVFQAADTSTVSKVADGFWEIAPRVVLRDGQDELSYDFRYQPIYTKYFGAGNENRFTGDTTDADGWDHYARGDVDWSISPRNFAGVDGSFVNSRLIRAELVDSGIGPGPEVNSSDGQRVTRSLGTAYFSHYFTQTLSARVDYALDDLDFNRSDQSDSRAQTGGAGLTYALSPVMSVGTRVSFRYRQSKINQLFPLPPPFLPIVSLTETRTDTRTINLSFSISRQLTKTIAFSVQAGPSFIETDTDRELGVGLTQKSNTNDQSVFAVVSLSKEWQKGKVEVAYSRYETGGGNTASSSIVDDVSIYGKYRFDLKWDVWMSFGWNRRKQLSNGFAVSNDIDLTRYRAVGTLTRNILPRLDVVARIDYIHRKEKQSAPLLNDPVTESLTGWLSLRYNFDPIVF